MKFDRVVRSCKGIKEYEHISEQFEQYVEEHPIVESLKFLETDQHMFFRFAVDFVNKTLKCPELQDPWLEIAVEFAIGLSNQKFNKLKKYRVLRLFMIKQYEEQQVSYFHLCLLPLSILKSPPSKTMIERFQGDFSNESFLPTTVAVPPLHTPISIK